MPDELTLLLVGSGHANLSLLAVLARRGQANIRVTVVSPSRTTYLTPRQAYCLADAVNPKKEEKKTTVSVVDFCRWSGARYIESEVSSISASSNKSVAVLANGDEVPFDYACVAVGSTSLGPVSLQKPQPGAPSLAVPLRPYPEFHKAFSKFYDSVKSGTIRLRGTQPKEGGKVFRVVVVGDGPQAVETALALRVRGRQLEMAHTDTKVTIKLVGSERLPFKGRAVYDRLDKELVRAEIQYIPGLPIESVTHASAFTPASVKMQDESMLSFDLGVMCLPSTRADLPNFGLPADPETNRFTVESTLQVTGMPNVFALGSCALMPGKEPHPTWTHGSDISLSQGTHVAGAILKLAARPTAKVPKFKPPRRSLAIMSFLRKRPRVILPRGGPDVKLAKGVASRKAWADRDRTETRLFESFDIYCLAKPLNRLASWDYSEAALSRPAPGVASPPPRTPMSPVLGAAVRGVRAGPHRAPTPAQGPTQLEVAPAADVCVVAFHWGEEATTPSTEQATADAALMAVDKSREYRALIDQENSKIAAKRVGKPLASARSTSKSPFVVIARKRPILAGDSTLLRPEDVINSIYSCSPTTYVHRCQDNVDTTTAIKTTAFKTSFSADEATTTAQLYDTHVRPIVSNVAAGKLRQGTIFAYGQTGSGKTFTISGILGAAVADMFRHSSSVTVSAIEMLGKTITDVHTGAPVSICEVGRHVEIRGVSAAICPTEADLAHRVVRASELRATASTARNSTSSRSHLVYSFMFESGAQLRVLDLAGSESTCDQLEHDKDRVKQAASINTSLMALKECLRRVAEGSGFVPFRQDPLTLLLKPCLDRTKGKLPPVPDTAVIVTVSPLQRDCRQSVASLRYGALLCSAADHKDEGLMAWGKEQTAMWVETTLGFCPDPVRNLPAKRLFTMTVEQLKRLIGKDQAGQALYDEIYKLKRARR
ncbi:Kinesin motor domain [Carpediemonas membranifera]|uniref:Kinesin motor domain n=1 Tax=Carpediemonas membranifera TaxID=201153 RepID=A0A8J6B6C1_9EUKA|nr:Kinesin motor domain [Carpediemonas membranifera]|eukprot:KAG9395194.1 Kinesin motor domain [Carpediemonas membranifera]